MAVGLAILSFVFGWSSCDLTYSDKTMKEANKKEKQ